MESTNPRPSAAAHQLHQSAYPAPSYPPSISASSVPSPKRRVSHEPYGAVKMPTYNGRTQVQRRSYVLSPSTLPGGASDKTDPSSGESHHTYQHNIVIAAFLGTALALLLWNHTSPAPLRAFMYSGLVLYALDLANLRDVSIVGIWVAFAFLAATNAWCLLMQTEDHEASGATMLVVIFRMMAETLLFMCFGCWATLQFQWLHKDTPFLAKMTEQILHTCLIPISSSVIAYQLMSTAVDNVGTDRVVTVAPFLFAFLMTLSMLFVGCCESSYSPTTKDANKKEWCVPNSTSLVHSALLLLIPPLMHVLSFRKRIMSSYASYDELFDLILVWTVPYLMHYGIHILHQQKGRQWHGPYTLTVLFGKSSGVTLLGALVPILVSAAASFALQQNYLIPFCQSISYQFNGHDMPHVWVTSAYLSVATFATLVAIWINGKVSSKTNEPLFGEYHDDAVQLSLALSGLCVGKSMGMPWNLTPLPILAFLGFTIWAATRMLRYLAILLFVVHSAGLVTFSYRFAGITNIIKLAIPGVSMNLTRFGMLVIVSSLVAALVMGLAVRSKGGLGSEFMKRVDLAGLFLTMYSILLAVLEITLLNEEIPFRNLLGIEGHEAGTEVEAFIYQPRAALCTAALIAGLALYLQYCKIIYPKNGIVALATSLGKAVTVVIHMAHLRQHKRTETDGNKEAAAMFLRFGIASFLLIVMMAPRAFLTPIHVKSSGSIRRKSKTANGRSWTSTPATSATIIFTYALLVLPITLVASVPTVLHPLMGVISGHWSRGYYTKSPAASEVFGLVATLWGLAMLAMLNHYLPDGGGELWKKVSALSFLMGIGVAIAGPTVPDWFHVLRNARKSTNPFAMLSSIGSELLTGNRSRAGGWGLISASLATLLAVTGPLELRERRSPGGPKDKFLLFRMMVFSVMFGCGVSWFITLQSMSEESFMAMFITSVACMAMSFFGTVAGVLGYFLELEDFDEVEQIVKVWAMAFPIFGFTAAVSTFVKDSAHMFGVGGWLSTYLAVCAFATFGFSVVVRSREVKDGVSRGLANLCCMFSWIAVTTVLYGRYGVAGLDAGYDITIILGLPASVFGTIVASLLLFALEGESQSRRHTRKVRGTVDQSKTKRSSAIGLTLTSLARSNQFAPSLTSIVVVLVVSTAYAILLRGCGVFEAATSHNDTFSSIFGKGGAASVQDDLAKLAEKNMIHSRALVVSARLAASGFWTSKSLMGPLLHLSGLVATLPNLYLGLKSAWGGPKVSSYLLTLVTPLNVVPLVFCRGIPTLRVLAIVGLVCGVLQLLFQRSSTRRSNMRI